ncbi:pentatricopeptide repeat-containing protein [Quercus suber]|uniref:Pentatricopeptide repeat-containing protein n=1 Tax=Quercus suber TaxID=58331 RepID=A0AAW0LG15_QUESU
MIPSCCCSLTSLSSSTSISKFISDQPYLTMLEKQCTNMKDLQKIHANLIKTGLAKDTIAASRILAFCASPAGDMNYAYLLFTHIQNPNLFAWNTIIRGFSQSSTPHNAISLFIDMLISSPIEPQRLTYPSVFKAYTQLGLAHDGAQLHGRIIKEGALRQGEWIHDFIRKNDFELNVIVSTAIIDMYCKCGTIEKALQTFEAAPKKGLPCWNSMIFGLAMNGCEEEAIHLFSKLQSMNLKPDSVSFIGVLTALTT